MTQLVVINEGDFNEIQHSSRMINYTSGLLNTGDTMTNKTSYCSFKIYDNTVIIRHANAIRQAHILGDRTRAQIEAHISYA